MNNVIPLKVKQNFGFNGINDILGKFSNLPLDQNLLLPILFIFMSNKKGAGLNIFNNFGEVFSKLNLSPQNIENSLKTLKVLDATLGSGKNSAMLGTFSTVLQTTHKLSTIQGLVSNLNTITTAVQMVRNTDSDSEVENENEFSSSNINYKMLDAVSDLLNENSKQTIKQVNDIMQTITILRGVWEEYSKDGGFNIENIFGIIKPLLGDQSQNIDGMGSIMKMFSSSSNKTNTDKKGKRNRRSKRFNNDKVINILDYDQEDDTNIIDEILDSMMEG